MSTAQKLCLDDIRHLYTRGSFYETHVAKPKTRVEMRMIEASALIRSEPKWAEQLHDEEIRQEWTAQVKETLNLTDKEVEYVFEELEYYAQLKTDGCSGEELGGVDKVWINDAASNFKLANKFKDNVAKLASDHVAVHSSSEDNNPPAAVQVLVDPFMFSFSSKASQFYDKPITSPEASLDFMGPAVEPDSVNTGLEALDITDENKSETSTSNNTSGIADPSTIVLSLRSPDEEHLNWLPTDFIINNDGSVSIRSYINNLHPTRYATLYQTISKVFAKFVSLLEQVATDVIHPRDLRVTVDGKGALEYTEPEPQPFCPANRPKAPYSMHGLTVQASVEIVNINLTPDRPAHSEGRWQAMGGYDENIFAVGMYFCEMENIASAKLKLRDPVKRFAFRNQEEKNSFCKTHDVTESDETSCMFSQEFEGIDIKAGRFICYPNLYQVKMPSFTLADSTKPGSVKCIAFYVVDPSTRVMSTDSVCPRDPTWIKTGELVTLSELDITSREAYEEEWAKRDFLRRKHAKRNERVGYKFEVSLEVGDYMSD
ncbi:hypothetical protein H4S07_000016 [Coemansia furcata]|uniref:Uncharacterized protein n=1 Tax=Coemansia furcata TaxID=417177 RepID=A0ACC1LR95_9FUNG|nr:hypothetical protein H4S07_000016 [Coemansia furcata]